jgi:hypothetical protein
MGVDFASTIDLSQSGTSQLIGSSAILQPNTPSFSAVGNTGAFGINAYVVFPTIVYNIGSGYNASNGLFTAPVGGVYYFVAYFLAESAPVGEYRHSLLKNGGVYSGGYFIQTKVAGYWTMECGGHIQLAAGDTVGMYRTLGGVSHVNGSYQAFGGHLI